ncbi:hypothetical protein QBC44DRAFT_99437 [Cladorrhinum sp. PSN332]|nr:hypothetical protein QBC44DRAFT_99437 [Cladorrhinum sp. PSN332]
MAHFSLHVQDHQLPASAACNGRFHHANGQARAQNRRRMASYLPCLDGLTAVRSALPPVRESLSHLLGPPTPRSRQTRRRKMADSGSGSGSGYAMRPWSDSDILVTYTVRSGASLKNLPREVVLDDINLYGHESPRFEGSWLQIEPFAACLPILLPHSFDHDSPAADQTGRQQQVDFPPFKQHEKFLNPLTFNIQLPQSRFFYGLPSLQV